MAGKEKRPGRSMITGPSRSGGGSSLLLSLIDRAGGTDVKLTPEALKFSEDPLNNPEPERFVAPGGVMSRMFFPSKNEVGSSLNQQLMAEQLSRGLEKKNAERVRRESLADATKLEDLELTYALFGDDMPSADLAALRELQGAFAERNLARGNVDAKGLANKGAETQNAISGLDLQRLLKTFQSRVGAENSGYELTTAKNNRGKDLVDPEAEAKLAAFRTDKSLSDMNFDLAEPTKARKLYDLTSLPNSTQAYRSVLQDGEAVAMPDAAGTGNLNAAQLLDFENKKQNAILSQISQTYRDKQAMAEIAARGEEARKTAEAKSDGGLDSLLGGGTAGPTQIAGPDGSPLFIQPKAGKPALTKPAAPSVAAPVAPAEPSFMDAVNNLQAPKGLPASTPASTMGTPSTPVGQAPALPDLSSLLSSTNFQPQPRPAAGSFLSTDIAPGPKQPTQFAGGGPAVGNMAPMNGLERLMNLVDPSYTSKARQMRSTPAPKQEPLQFNANELIQRLMNTISGR